MKIEILGGATLAKKIEFEFIVDVPPDDETIKESHKIIAQSYLNRYGFKNMKKVLKVLESTKGIRK